MSPRGEPPSSGGVVPGIWPMRANASTARCSARGGASSARRARSEVALLEAGDQDTDDHGAAQQQGRTAGEESAQVLGVLLPHDEVGLEGSQPGPKFDDRQDQKWHREG